MRGFGSSVVAVTTLVCAICASTADATAVPGWSWGPNMAFARAGGHAITLQNGTVLLAGGGVGTTPPQEAERFDPASGWSSAGIMVDPLITDTATLLQNGKVLLAGGFDSLHSPFVLAGAQIYDPGTNSWSSAASMSTPRDEATATLLPNGDVLVAGGYNDSATALSSAELYHPATDTWSPAGNMGTARTLAAAVLLPNGKVLVAGGFGAQGLLASAELYDPQTKSWTSAAPVSNARADATVVALKNGDALLIGGNGGGFYQREAEEYHWATDSWSDAGSMLEASGAPNAVALPDGRVLTVGGPGVMDAGGDAPELYDPASNRWYAAGVEPLTAYDSSLSLLPNGTVMAAGGDTSLAAGGTEGGATLYSTELYTPGPTPSITAVGVQDISPTTAAISGSYDVSTAHVQSCEVSYGATALSYGATVQYGQSAPCAQPTASSSGAGTITAVLSGLQPSTTYHYQVSVSDGAVIATTADQLLATLPAPPASSQSLTTPPAPVLNPPARCVVPKVEGLRLAAARRALAGARCRVDKITRTRALKIRQRRHRGTIEVVIRQSIRSGTVLAANTSVDLTLGLSHSRNARKPHQHLHAP